MKGSVIVINRRDRCPAGFIGIDTTSNSNSWTKGLSPFILGPCECSLDNCRSWNVENAWQYSKVYECHDDNGRPNAEWYEWAISGFSSKRAERYPMGCNFGKAPKPLYSWYRGKKYGYIEARKAIYIPLYVKSLVNSEAYGHLRAIHDLGLDIALRDFDGYRIDSLGMTYDDVVDNPDSPLGHAFLIAMTLEGKIRKYVKGVL